MEINLGTLRTDSEFQEFENLKLQSKRRLKRLNALDAPKNNLNNAH